MSELFSAETTVAAAGSLSAMKLLLLGQVLGLMAAK